eukprot:ctg_771.g303
MFQSRSERVKCVDVHPTEPWVLASLYTGQLLVYDYHTGAVMKQFDVSDQPLRAAKFVVRKQWIVVVADDLYMRVYNYNTLEKVREVEVHQDYVRSVAVHPTRPLVLTASDDMLIKLWDWEKSWNCVMVYEGHSHYVMQVAFNPKDPNTFASASLDRTVRIWSLASPVPNLTLEGHEKGVNCVDYYPGGDRPYLVSGADDCTVIIWDIQTKTPVQQLHGHSGNISAVAFHPSRPIVFSGSEDGTVRLWNSNTYRLENTLSYGLDRCWSVSCSRASNLIALGFDMGVRQGGAVPTQRHSVGGVAANGQRGDTGRRAAVGGVQGPGLVGHVSAAAGALTQRPFRVGVRRRRVHHLHGAGVAQQILRAGRRAGLGQHPGRLRGARGHGARAGVCQDARRALGDADAVRRATRLRRHPAGRGRRRRVDVAARQVIWSDSVPLVAITAVDSLYILAYDAAAVEAHLQAPARPGTDEGIEGSFAVLHEFGEQVQSGRWHGECFFFTSAAGRIGYVIGGEVALLAHADRPLYVLGYLPSENRLFLIDRDHQIVAYTLLPAVMQFKALVNRGEQAAALSLLPNIPPAEHNRLARALEARGQRELAFEIATDPEYRFDMAVALGRLDEALPLVEAAPSEAKWRQLVDLALAANDLALAEQCQRNAAGGRDGAACRTAECGLFGRVPEPRCGRLYRFTARGGAPARGGTAGAHVRAVASAGAGECVEKVAAQPRRCAHGGSPGRPRSAAGTVSRVHRALTREAQVREGVSSAEAEAGGMAPPPAVPEAPRGPAVAEASPPQPNGAEPEPPAFDLDAELDDWGEDDQVEFDAETPAQE